MIRQATYSDIPALLYLGQVMHAESAYSPYDYNPAKVAELAETLIDAEHGIALVAEDEGVIQGAFLGVVYPHWFGDDLVSTDYALFMHPDCRGGTQAYRLIKRYIVEARAKGAKQIMLANSTGVVPSRVAALFESLGFHRLGYVFELQA
jgi:GNAT superfamily N-acetyltransferase